MPDPRSRPVAATVFARAWPMAVLALPWQTRWFVDASWAGWPWEMGRWSIYASWIPMAVAIVAGWRSASSRPGIRWKKCWPVAALLVSTLLATSGDAMALRAWGIWWIQAVMLAAFVWTVASHASREGVAAWFVGSLWPHAILAFIQSATNAVVGSKWLGVAAQDAARSGVAVVDAGGRFLRAYGGFPHPNILGAWMAVGAVVALDGAWRSQSRQGERWKLWLLSSAVFSSVVALSVSRAAWIGLCLGACGWVAMRIREMDRRRMLASAMVPLMAFGLAVVSRPSLFRARASIEGRLEAKSVGERVDSYRTAIRLWRERPMLGTGINADLLRMAPDRPLPAPLQPIHALPLLWLAQLGVSGVVLLGFALCRLGRGSDPRLAIPLGLAILPSATFDHFLWTFWAGQALIGIAWVIGRRDAFALRNGETHGTIEP